ncbi:MAG: C39 family peptidase [Candidatus Dormibacteraeota bacterium]|uniref:C39 family peptidase n=1 Tax=Candidatus Amunia macphersoniae TaxID=3127014 RepID=A0A934KJ53_9BACT|nr:C39 family peptidase [Candidatus Dormibacteraeota bacterium]
MPTSSPPTRRAVLAVGAALVMTGMLGGGPGGPLTAHASIVPQSAKLDVTPVQQIYPLDCEAAALQSALGAIGINISQDWALGQFGADTTPPVMSNGRPVRWADPYQTFVGDVRGRFVVTGYGVYYTPIVAAAQAAGATAYGGEHWIPRDLYAEVAAGHPVVVRVPHLMHSVSVGYWTAWDGRSVWYTPVDHAQVLMAYDYAASTVTLADPYDNQIHVYSMGLFENRFAAEMGSAVVVSPGPGIHMGAVDPASKRAAAIAVDDSNSWVMRSNGSSFSAPQSLASTPFRGSRGTFFEDVDGPGKPASGIAVNDSSVWVMHNNGNGFDYPAQWSNVPFYGTVATLVADVDGTGRASPVAVNESSVWVMHNNGSGFDHPAQWSGGPFYGTHGTFAAVLDGSHRASLVAVNESSIYVMANLGSSFEVPRLWASANFFGSRGTFIADIDGSGRASAVAINDDSIWVESNTGGGAFASPRQWATGAFYADWEYMADVDGSGRASAVAVSRTTTWVKLNTGGSFAAPNAWANTPFYGTH